MQYSKREAHDIKRALENVLHETISAKVLQVEAAEKGGCAPRHPRYDELVSVNKAMNGLESQGQLLF